MRAARVRPSHLGLAGLLALLVGGPARGGEPGAPPASVDAPHVTVGLAAERVAVAPGAPAALGVHFALEEGWHVYWRNPGDSGEAPRIRWTLPEGFAAGEIRWPVPERIPTGPLVNFGYEGEVLLPVDVAVPGDLPAGGTVAVEAEITWLVCREDCIPGKARLGLRLPVAAGGPPALDDRWAPVFARARGALPVPGAATLEDAGDGHVTLTVPGAATAGAEYAFYPGGGDVLDLAAPQPAAIEGDTVRLRLKKGPLAPARLTELEGLVVVSTARGRSALAVRAGPPAAAPAAPAESDPITPWLALLFAFLGGALLNLMPCVFPVLSLKVLGFVEQAREARGRARAHGLAFAAGVVVSFWVLAGVLIAIRAGGEQLGWGFQLQSPVFVAVLAAFIFVLALSLAGVFEFGLSLTALGGGHRPGGGYGGSFTTGALATVVATPCTAPFMGPALGFALTRPPAMAMLVFTALALGMAAPYVLLAWFPGALSRLPRPGPWMATFKQVMAFPLFATVLWLLAVLGLQVGTVALVEVLGGLLVLAFAAWLWGHVQRRGPSGRGLVALGGVALIAAAIGLGVGVRAAARSAPAPAAAADGFWQPWSPERVAALRAEGRPVFVNFTAAWCISCQVNERLVFSTDAVRADFAEHGVVALEADWTHKDPEIARALAEFGRQGVPLYVYYPGRAGARPRVLPPVITREMLLDAFTRPQ